MAGEKQFEEKVKRFLKDQECWYIKYWGGGGFTRSGVPDLLVCCDGTFLGVEVKAVRGKPSDLQIRELHRIQDSGGIAILLYPQDFEWFKQLILAIKKPDWNMVNVIEGVFKRRMKDYE